MELHIAQIILLILILIIAFLVPTLASLYFKLEDMKMESREVGHLMAEDSRLRSETTDLLSGMLEKQIDLQRLNNALLNFHNEVIIHKQKEHEQKKSIKSKKVSKKQPVKKAKK